MPVRPQSKSLESISVRLVCEGLPEGAFDGFQGLRKIQVTLQTQEGFDVGFRWGDHALAWTSEIVVKRGPGGALDFAGSAVHGNRGERFFYLSWSGERAGLRQMFRRIKLHLRDLTPALVEQARTSGGVLEARVHAVAKDGGPACASVPILGGWAVRRLSRPDASSDPK